MVAEQVALAASGRRASACAWSRRRRSARRSTATSSLARASARRRGRDPRRRGGGAARVPGRHADARPRRSPGTVGVVDVGGGSTEIAVGTVAGGVTWSASFRVGSGALADRYLRSRPAVARRAARGARARVRRASARAPCPHADCAVAVGGSAASLRRLVGDVLDADVAASARSARWPARPPPRSRARLALDARARAAAARRASSSSTPPPSASAAAADRPRRPARRRRAGPGPNACSVRGQGRGHRGRPVRAVRAAPRRASCALRADELFEHAENVLDTSRHRARPRHARRLAPPARGAGDLRAVLPAAATSRPSCATSRQLADALGERRDPDVHIDDLEELEQGLPGRRPARASSALVAAAARAPGARQRDARRRARRTSRSAGCTSGCTRCADGAEELIDREGAQRQGARPATAPLGDNAERIVRVRLDELYLVHAQGGGPRREVVALHDMRIAAKRLRYILEVTGSCFGPYASERGEAWSRTSRTCSARSTTATCSCPRSPPSLERAASPRTSAHGRRVAEGPRPEAAADTARDLRRSRRAPGAPARAPQRAVRAASWSCGATTNVKDFARARARRSPSPRRVTTSAS